MQISIIQFVFWLFLTAVIFLWIGVTADNYTRKEVKSWKEKYSNLLSKVMKEESDYEDKLEMIRQLAEENYDLQKRTEYLLNVKKALLDSFKLIHEENQINKMISRVALRNYTDMYDEVKDLKAWKQVALGEFHSGGIKVGIVKPITYKKAKAM